MKRSIAVVDYGMGNLHSVAKALASTGARVTVSDNRKKLAAGDLLVLPGVGSFGAAMTNLAKKRLDDFIRDWVIEERPFLGICLGLQLLFERSEESPREPGLGIFKGRVVRFRRKKLTIPHMGWNTVVTRQPEKFGVGPSDYFYFVHSYFPEPTDRAIVFTETDYGGRFCSAVATDNVIATQYHPEKSGDTGLRLLKQIVTSMKEAA